MDYFNKIIVKCRDGLKSLIENRKPKHNFFFHKIIQDFKLTFKAKISVNCNEISTTGVLRITIK